MSPRVTKSRRRRKAEPTTRATEPTARATEPTTRATEPTTRATERDRGSRTLGAATARRAVGLLIVAGAVVGGVLLDRQPVTVPPAAFGARDELPMPALRPAASLGASWFCPGVPAGDPAAGSAVILANPTDEPVSATVSVTASDPAVAPVVRPVDVAARTQVEVAVTDYLVAPFAAVQVETRSGSLVVEQRAAGKLEATAPVISVTPCATAPSQDWYFADGSTTTEADETLLVYNPFLDDAVVDLVFADDSGPRRPPTLQSRPVPARSLLALNVNDTIQRKPLVSVSLHAKVGRVVLGRYQLYTAKPRRALVAGLATPSPGTNWTFADGERVAGDGSGSVATSLVVYNPGVDDAQVSVTILPDSGSAAAALTTPADAATADPNVTVDPAATTVDPAATAAVDPNAAAPVGADPLAVTVSVEAGHSVLVPLDQLPNGRFSTLVTSSIPVVVERQLLRVGDPRVVTTVQFGSRLSSPRWAFATAASAGWSATLVVANPAPQAGTVTVQTLTPAGLVTVSGMADVPVPATGTIRLDLGTAGIGAAAVVVQATTDVVVERVLAPAADQPGSSTSLGMPVVDG